MDKIFFYLLFFISFSIQQFDANFIEDQMKVRLPDTLVPEKYELDIYTDVVKDQPNFYGEVTITIKCVETTNRIIVNDNFLKIQRIQVWTMDKRELTSKAGARKGYLTQDHQVSSTITVDEDLKENSRYEIKLKYQRSPFLSDLFGYIFRPYEELSSHQNIQHLAFTRMKEIEAKRVIPCMDQIGLKSAFSIRLRHPAGAKSFSNAKKIAEDVPIDEPRGWVMDQFEDVESMSTFSLAFVVADYSSIGPVKISDNVPYIEIKLWAETEDVLKNMEIVMEVSSQIYTFFFNYFRIPHKLGKLDLIVIPNTHDVIQDSYGLIILRQEDFLDAFYESNENLTLKYTIVSELCNAMSKQWISHSVTMNAWNANWLHFGLNFFLQKLCVGSLHLFDEWRSVDENNLVESFFDVLKTEERGDYNPIVSLGSGSYFTTYSGSPTTYSKVHHIIRMLSFILESEKDVFRKSLENYVKEFEDGITDVDKTWEIFTKTVNEEDSSLLPDGITIKMIMDSWLTQKGHPLINVSIDKSTKDIIVTQEPFNFSNTGGSQINEAQRPCWIIPLSYTTKENRGFQKVKVLEWLRCDGKPVRIKNVNIEEWILFNLELHVPCRVNYENPIWLSIEKLLKNPEEYSQIDVLTRIHLTSDMFASAEAEKLSYEYLFTALEYVLGQEENYDSWRLIISELDKIRLRWNGTELNSYFMQYVRDILRPVVRKKVLKGIILTFEKFLKTERKNDELEIQIIKAACIFEAIECVQLIHKLLGEWKEKKFGEYTKLIPADLQESVFCLAIKKADMVERDFFFGMYSAESGSNLRKVILKASGCSGKREILEKYLNWGMKSKITSPEISLKVFEALSLNAEAYPIIMDYLTMDYQSLEKNLRRERTHVTLENFLSKAIDATKTSESYKKLIAMLPTIGKANKDAAKMVGESQFNAEKNINWLERKEEETINYFTPK